MIQNPQLNITQNPHSKRKNGWFSDTWRRLRKNRLAIVGLIILILMILIAIFAPWVAPYGYDDQNIKAAMIFPCKEYPFGTDNFGRDILSRVIYGSRISMQVGLISVGIALMAGGILGAVAAYFSHMDNIIMRTIDVFMAIPDMLLAIAIAASLGAGMRNLMIAVGVSNVPRFARVVRAAVLTVKEQEFVEAARSIGSSNLRIITTDILPNCLSQIIVQATLGVASAIILGSSLSYLGFGIQAPLPEWGAMLSAGRVYIRTHWYMTVIPGLAIMLAVYALNVLGDGLRDALDPRLKN